MMSTAYADYGMLCFLYPICSRYLGWAYFRFVLHVKAGMWSIIDIAYHATHLYKLILNLSYNSASVRAS